MIYLLCRAAISIYFIEYTNSIENSSEIKVVIYDKFTDVKIMDNNYYIFILGPDLRNHIGYLKERPNIAFFNFRFYNDLEKTKKNKTWCVFLYLT